MCAGETHATPLCQITNWSSCLGSPQDVEESTTCVGRDEETEHTDILLENSILSIYIFIQYFFYNVTSDRYTLSPRQSSLSGSPSPRVVSIHYSTQSRLSLKEVEEVQEGSVLPLRARDELLKSYRISGELKT